MNKPDPSCSYCQGKGKVRQVTIGDGYKEEMVDCFQCVESIKIDTEWTGKKVDETAAPLTLAASKELLKSLYTKFRKNPTSDGFIALARIMLVYQNVVQKDRESWTTQSPKQKVSIDTTDETVEKALRRFTKKEES